MNKQDRIVLFYAIQIISIYNALKLGFEIKKIDKNSYEIYHKTDPSIFDNIDLNKFVDNITQIKYTINAI